MVNEGLKGSPNENVIILVDTVTGVGHTQCIVHTMVSSILKNLVEDLASPMRKDVPAWFLKQHEKTLNAWGKPERSFWANDQLDVRHLFRFCKC